MGKNQKIGIIGCGNMEEILQKRLSKNYSLLLFDRHKEKMEALEKEGHGKRCDSLEKIFQDCTILILAIKPQGIQAFAKELPCTLSNHILVSLLSGIDIASLEKLFHSKGIIRMMPNLAVACGESAIALTAKETFPAKEKGVSNFYVKH